MSKFGWSLPAGCGKLPGEEDEEPDHYVCPECNHRLDWNAMETCYHKPAVQWITYNPDYHSEWVKKQCRVNPITNVLEFEEYLGGDFTTIICRNCGCETAGDAVFCDDIYDEFSKLHIPEIQELYSDYEQWEDAAPDAQTVIRHYKLIELLGLKRGTPLYTALDCNWYFLRKFTVAPTTYIVWLNGTGEKLVKENNFYYTRWYLNEVQIFPKS